LVFIFLNSKREDKRFWTEWQHAFPEINLLLISSSMPFLFVNVIPKYWNFAMFLKDLLAL
jgi:hypothetical protein